MHCWASDAGLHLYFVDGDWNMSVGFTPNDANTCSAFFSGEALPTGDAPVKLLTGGAFVDATTRVEASGAAAQAIEREVVEGERAAAQAGFAAEGLQ